jgi:hypothetical protein
VNSPDLTCDTVVSDSESDLDQPMPAAVTTAVNVKAAETFHLNAFDIINMASKTQFMLNKLPDLKPRN